MNPATFFRLSVRAIGVLLIGMNIASPVWFVQSIVQALRIGEFGAFDEFTTATVWVFNFVTHFAGLAFGVYLTFFANGLIRACVRDAMGRCGVCGQDLRGVSAEKCPQCGAARSL